MLVVGIFLVSVYGGVQGSTGFTFPPFSPLNKKSTQAMLPILSSLTTELVGEERKKFVEAAFGFADAVMEYNIGMNAEQDEMFKNVSRQVKKMSDEISAALKEVSHVCAARNLNMISRKAGVQFAHLLEALADLFNGDEYGKQRFLDESEKISIMKNIYSVKALLDFSKWDPIRTVMDADQYRKSSTLIEMRKRIVETVNMLALVEVFRLKFSTDSSMDILLKQADTVMDAVDEVNAVLENHTEEYKDPLLSALQESHTNYRFLVAVYNDKCDLGKIVTADTKDRFLSEPHRTIVYKSRHALTMAEDTNNYTIPIKELHGQSTYCGWFSVEDVRYEYKKMLRSNYWRSTGGRDEGNRTVVEIPAGFMLFDNGANGCKIAVADDRRSFGFKKISVMCRRIPPMEILERRVAYSFTL